MINNENECNNKDEGMKSKPIFIMNSFLQKIFCSNFSRLIMKESKKVKYRMEIFIILLIGILSFLIRLFSVLRNEPIIHEYDPYFNYKLTNILNEKGFYEFWNYFDDKSWFPLGRITGQTLFPGLMITSFLIHKIFHFFGFLVDVKNICIYIGPIFSFFTCIISYLLTKEIYHFSGAALLSSLFVSISPSHISRTVAGSYDNESISIFLLLLCIYNWIKCLKKGTLLSVLICSVSTYYMALSWGAYIFIINSISLFMLVIIILKKCTIKHCILYNVYYILTTILFLNIPCINHLVFTSIEHLATHAIYLLCTLLIFFHFIITYFKLNEQNFKKKFIQISFIFFILIFKFLVFTDKLSWNHRSRTLLDPTYASKHNPIVASISEHQPTTWSSYFFDIHLVLLFFPIGLYKCLKRNATMELFFMGIFSILCLYFSSLMVRLLLIFSPFACILSGIGLSSLIGHYVIFFRIPRNTFLSSIVIKSEYQNYFNTNKHNDNHTNNKNNIFSYMKNDNKNDIINSNCDNANNNNNCESKENKTFLKKIFKFWKRNKTNYLNNDCVTKEYKYFKKNENSSKDNKEYEQCYLLNEEKINANINDMKKTKKKKFYNNNVLTNDDRYNQMILRKLNFNRVENDSLSILTSMIIIILLIYYVILIIFHSTWCSSIAYSESNITFYSRNKNGDRYINDDIRQMYKWINKNTKKDSKIVAWWDYGYQLSVMSDRITYIDNNTWNNTHIATIGLILSTNEKNAYEYLKKLDADYLLVSYGGYSKNSSDDLNKFLWILKITNKSYNFINPLLYYYHDKYHPLGKNATPFMINSVLYKLSYYNLTNSEVKGYDYIRKIEIPEIKNLTYFEEVFTSDVWGFRLYKIKEYV
ncbi:oligosaccharyl transferase STT3 subunit, putative [Plasmodium gallinaceum]|uniref:dolichyl-diphosphooligosaccharide--protein glycotransferase n=1 Tax=Plasmodium gallinaceum TaxID=5849 RepID=A0A1J1GVE7_PLAGA|nr:oligosaccharyl transferase STT3 subunit, putative [Plasmodium gallinaceum]CRG96214.1 oligosaccharyl transferase STT3 subunit, putative [Plasmodium gallinaceum]